MGGDLHRGTVVEFDDPRGYGTVAEPGGPPYWFHCTQITDGTRTIAPGAEVSFEVVAGRRGLWEAVRITPIR